MFAVDALFAFSSCAVVAEVAAFEPGAFVAGECVSGDDAVLRVWLEGCDNAVGKIAGDKGVGVATIREECTVLATYVVGDFPLVAHRAQHAFFGHG